MQGGSSADGALVILHIHTQEKNMSNTKTGFEIRADLLSQAQGILENNLERENQKVYLHNDNFPNDKRCLGDQFIGVDQVISVARQLNEFVNEK